MKESKAYLIALVTAIFLSVVLCASPCFASDTSSTNQAEPTITVPLTQWNELKSNNEKALNLIEASNIPLTEAQTLVVKQGQELTEAHNTINRLERIGQSQSGLSEARSYLERNAEIIRRVEEHNRAGQPHNQATTNATQSIPSSGGWSDNRSSDSSIER